MVCFLHYKFLFYRNLLVKRKQLYDVSTLTSSRDLKKTVVFFGQQSENWFCIFVKKIRRLVYICGVCVHASVCVWWNYTHLLSVYSLYITLCSVRPEWWWLAVMNIRHNMLSTGISLAVKHTSLIQPFTLNN